MDRPDDHEGKDHDSKHQVAPAALGARRKNELSQRADVIGPRDCPQSTLPELDRRMGEGDGCQKAQ